MRRRYQKCQKLVLLYDNQKKTYLGYSAQRDQTAKWFENKAEESRVKIMSDRRDDEVEKMLYDLNKQNIEECTQSAAAAKRLAKAWRERAVQAAEKQRFYERASWRPWEAEQD